jgi:hypothetical protein
MPTEIRNEMKCTDGTFTIYKTKRTKKKKIKTPKQEIEKH